MNDAGLLKSKQLSPSSADTGEDKASLPSLLSALSKAAAAGRPLVAPVVLALVVCFSICTVWRALAAALFNLQFGRIDMACVLYTGAIGLVALILAKRTQGFVRAAVLVQLAVLSLVALFAFGWKQSAAPFIDVICAALCGATAGSLVQGFARQQQTLETQEYEIRLRRKQLKDAKLALVKNDEVERRLLAADLHDQVLHDLKVVRQKLNTCRDSLAPAEFDALQEDLAHAMSAVREVMDQLFPSSLEHLGLVGAIEECLDKAAERCGFETFVRCKLSDQEFDSISKVETLLLFRLIQEAVNNITKHAAAKSVSCHITKEADQLIFRITDDGNGFESGNDEGRGLRYMKQRADLIGAHIAWLSNGEGCGTVVEIRLNKTSRDSQKVQVTS